MGIERWEAIRLKVAEIGRAHVRAGVVGPVANETHKDADMTIGELALLHEFGNLERGGNIPERSFVRSTVRDPAIQAQFSSLVARVTREVIAGHMSRDAALAELGEWMAARVKERILNHEIRPEDAPATIAAKGHDVPLVGHTGQLADAVGFEVVK